MRRDLHVCYSVLVCLAVFWYWRYSTEHRVLTSATRTTTLATTCSQTQWHHNLSFVCHSFCGLERRSLCGGTNNARHRIQTCIRLAIDAGVGLIIPSITGRTFATNNTEGDQLDPAEHYFAWDLRECPQLHIRSEDANGLSTPALYHWKKSWGKGEFRKFLQAYSERGQSNIVLYGDPWNGWDYSRDPLRREPRMGAPG